MNPNQNSSNEKNWPEIRANGDPNRPGTYYGEMPDGENKKEGDPGKRAAPPRSSGDDDNNKNKPDNTSGR